LSHRRGGQPLAGVSGGAKTTATSRSAVMSTKACGTRRGT